MSTAIFTILLSLCIITSSAQTTATLLVRQPADTMQVAGQYFFDGQLCLVYEAEDGLHPITMNGRFLNRTELPQIAGIYFHDEYPVEQYRVTIVDMMGSEESIMVDSLTHWYKLEPEVLALIRQCNPGDYVVMDSIAVQSPEGLLPLNRGFKFMITN